MKLTKDRKSGKLIFILLIIHCSLLIVRSDWVQVNNGLTQHNVNALTAYNIGGINYIFAGTLRFGGQIFVSTNNGDSWTLSSNFMNDVWALSDNGNYVYAGTSTGLAYTTNNGLNWLTPVFPHWVSSLYANETNIFAGCAYFSYDPGGLFISTNNGIDWTRTTHPDAWINSIAVNGNNIFTAAGGGSNLVVGVFKSTDNGATWVQTPFPNTTVYSIAINGNNIFAGTSSLGVYLSTNNGGNWMQTSLTTGTIDALLIYINIIFAGGGVNGGGFLLTTNNGLTWINRSEGGVNLVETICISDGFIFVGTDGGGVYRRPLSELVGIKIISENEPDNFNLKQNYPNPFNPVTRFKFQIAKSSNVKIMIYTLTGRKIETITDKEMKPGTYEAEWNAESCSSGVYFYQLIADGNIIDTKKMIVIK